MIFDNEILTETERNILMKIEDDGLKLDPNIHFTGEGNIITYGLDM